MQTAAYVDRVMKMPGVQQWNDAARAEQDFLDFEEPYRNAPDHKALGGRLPEASGH